MNGNKISKIFLILGATLLLAGCGQKGEQEQSLEPGEVPAVLSDTLQVKRSSKTYVINGIGISGSNTVAIINNEVVVPGAELDPGVELESIHPTYASILIDGRKHMIRPESIQKELDKK